MLAANPQPVFRLPMRYEFSDCVLDAAQHVLMRGGVAVPVEPQVFDLLLLLVRNPDRLISRDEMIEVVWNGRIVSESAISARIAAARKAVGDNGKAQAIIRTVARRGLQMVGTVHSDAPITPAASPDISAPRIRYVQNEDGKSIAFSVIGSGTPVLRMSHMLTHIEAEWRLPTERAFFETIAAHHRVLRFDPVGFGLSDHDLLEMDYTRVARDIDRVADAAGFDRFAILSESGGCVPAITYAALYPDRVSKLITVGGYAEGRVVRADAQTTEPLRALIDAGWDTPDSPFTTSMLMSYFPEGPIEVIRNYAQMMQQAAPKQNVLRLRDATNSASLMALLPKVRCPTLVIHGRGDAVHPLSEARKLAAGIPGAELAVLETANHMPMQGNAVWDHYMATILEFLNAG
jgi:pimeloyl-ACP methyl ester carboxylesterase/DNA-binding winged helix-turn-helix (wHTH) protein